MGFSNADLVLVTSICYSREGFVTFKAQGQTRQSKLSLLKVRNRSRVFNVVNLVGALKNPPLENNQCHTPPRLNADIYVKKKQSAMAAIPFFTFT